MHFVLFIIIKYIFKLNNLTTCVHYTFSIDKFLVYNDTCFFFKSLKFKIQKSTEFEKSRNIFAEV